MTQPFPLVVIGAGPAGLTAAYEAIKLGMTPLVLEKHGQVGGISRTENYKGYRFDIGGHRFFTKVPEVEALWNEVLAEDFVTVRRLSRIYYGGKFFQYPLSLPNTLRNLGPVESARILLSYLKVKLRKPYPKEENLEEWVVNRFGHRLYQTFFKTYTEKVWGIPCTKIRADWAAQRIRGVTLKSTVINAVTKRNNTKSMIEQFQYPLLGPGMMWEAFQKRVETQGGEVRLNTSVVRIRHDGRRVQDVTTRAEGREEVVTGDHFINTMPVNELILRLDPLPPPDVCEAARSLWYRDFLIVGLILKRADVFPDNWIYVHSSEVSVGRIQNFKNWSPAMVPDPGMTCVGMEYFCTENDALWTMQDDELVRHATRELDKIGLACADDVVDGTVIRQPKAYPVYDETYQKHVSVLRDYLTTFENLQTVGRGGMHRYNNQDHSMLTAMLAVRNIQGQAHDVWQVNLERSYHEEFTVPKNGTGADRS